MTTEIVHADAAIPALQPVQVSDPGVLLHTHLSRLSEKTQVAYQGDLRCFAEFTGHDLQASITALVQLDVASAHVVASRYLEWMRTAKEWSPATVMRRYAALSSLLKTARVLGLVSWVLEISPPPAESLKDTRGPGLEALRKMLTVAAANTTRIGLRDYAILRLMADLGLRCGEVESLRLADLPADGLKIWIMGKGKKERLAVSLPPPTQQALANWIRIRGLAPGALFLNFDRAGQNREAAGSKLSARSIYNIVLRISEQCGTATHPHGIRHTAITAALEVTNGNIREVQKFSRHAKPETVIKYDDNRLDGGGKIANILSGVYDGKK